MEDSIEKQKLLREIKKINEEIDECPLSDCPLLRKLVDRRTYLQLELNRI